MWALWKPVPRHHPQTSSSTQPTSGDQNFPVPSQSPHLHDSSFPVSLISLSPICSGFTLTLAHGEGREPRPSQCGRTKGLGGSLGRDGGSRFGSDGHSCGIVSVGSWADSGGAATVGARELIASGTSARFVDIPHAVVAMRTLHCSPAPTDEPCESPHLHLHLSHPFVSVQPKHRKPSRPEAGENALAS